MNAKRLRKPKLKDGELVAYWGRFGRGEPPEIGYAWTDGRWGKRDANLLHSVFACRQPNLFAYPLFSKMEKSFIEELDARGYDLTTLKFSISKKVEASHE